MKKTKKKPDALDRAIRRMEAVERLALKAREAASMPTGPRRSTRPRTGPWRRSTGLWRS